MKAGVMEAWACPFCPKPLRYDGDNVQRIHFGLNPDGSNNMLDVKERVLAHKACVDANPDWKPHWEKP